MSSQCEKTTEDQSPDEAAANAEQNPNETSVISAHHPSFEEPHKVGKFMDSFMWMGELDEGPSPKNEK